MEQPMLSNIERSSSIEREPRTLKIHQLQSARDFAIYILSTRNFEEASRIFTEGLQPVVSADFMKRSNMRMNVDSGEEFELMLNMKKHNIVREAPEVEFRDIASAPF
ncbi:hypothetical protein Lal_00049710 [Lupinus albus]|uniref:Uncharacterized protein n=1 Tax=Lupinus albus TaxID=3870 RepID=A0A6A4PNA6_LUPAL|nr:hypothetical protein Lalb_Chr12g0203141 [Lupinus albus]KAF1867281.1 hypothetical protein Lal_00049710 [Lupinus albus]